MFKVIKICVNTCVPSLVASTEFFISPLVLVASVIEIDEVLKGSVDPPMSAIVVEDSENRAKHIKSTEIVGTDTCTWKIYVVLYNSKRWAICLLVII